MATFADPDPFRKFQYPNPKAAKRAIADFLSMPLGKLSGGQMEQVHTIVNATLDKKRVLDQVRQYFATRRDSATMLSDVRSYYDSLDRGMAKQELILWQARSCNRANHRVCP